MILGHPAVSSEPAWAGGSLPGTMSSSHTMEPGQSHHWIPVEPPRGCPEGQHPTSGNASVWERPVFSSGPRKVKAKLMT